MILLDVFEHVNKLFCWVQTPEGKNEFYWTAFQPIIFFHTFNEGFARDVFQHQRVEKTIRTHFVEKSISVLKITFNSMQEFKESMRFFEQRLRNVGTFFHVDIPLPEMFLFEHHLIPFGKVNVSVSPENEIISISNADDENELDYPLPNWKTLELDVMLNEVGETERIIANGHTFDSFPQRMGELLHLFQSIDPDIVTVNQPTQVVLQLMDSFKKIDPSFQFNRIGKDIPLTLKEQSYFSYGRVYYRQSPFYGKGRMLIPAYPHEGESGEFTLLSFIEGARVCHQTLQRLASHSVGAASNNRLCYEAYSRGYLIPYKIGIYERMKPFAQLIECDRGPFTFEPTIGFHSNVIELDFASMFPSIMEKYNLSPEKLLCSCCETNKIFSTGYHFCTKGKGIVPRVCAEFIRRRQAYKLRKDHLSKAKVAYLKWLLVVIFGYQAAQHKKIGTIEVHESINAIARETMLTTIHLAEAAGFEVLHAIVDSLYLKKKNTSMEEITALIQRINAQTGLKIEYKNTYTRMVFLPSIVRAYQPVPTRYYGISKEGELKLRGIEARQSSQPPLIRQMQTDVITQMKDYPHAPPLELFYLHLPILKQYLENLPYAFGEHLAFTIRLGKTDYVANCPQKIVLQQLKKKGRKVIAGQSIRFVIQHFSRKQYTELSAYQGEFDMEKYSLLLKKAYLHLFSPLQITFMELEDALEGKKQVRIVEYISPPVEKNLLPSIVVSK